MSSGTSLLLSRSPFQHHITSCSQTLCWISKVCIWTSWKLWFCLTSRLFLEITLPDSRQSWLSSNGNFQSQTSKEQEYCCTNCLCTFKKNFLILCIITCLYYHTKTNGKKRTNGRSSKKNLWFFITLLYLSIDQVN